MALGGCDTQSSPEASSGSPSGAIASPPASPTTVSPSVVSELPQNEDDLTLNPSSSASPITVTLYKADSQCEILVPEKVQVHGDRPLEATVGKILSNQSNQDFQLGGYRVSVVNGVATVDFRLAPGSRRQLVSLSTCEQFALFGSLRKTLTENPQWQIESVQFAERGKEIVF